MAVFRSQNKVTYPNYANILRSGQQLTLILKGREKKDIKYLLSRWLPRIYFNIF